MKRMTMEDLIERGFKNGDIYFITYPNATDHTGWRVVQGKHTFGLDCEVETSWTYISDIDPKKVSKIITIEDQNNYNYPHEISRFLRTFDERKVKDIITKIYCEATIVPTIEEDMFAKIDRITKEMDTKSLIERALKLSEECGEVAEAVLGFEGASGCFYKGKKADDVIEECADVMLVAMSIVSQVGDGLVVDKETFRKILETKIDKWEEKIKEEREADVEGDVEYE